MKNFIAILLVFLIYTRGYAQKNDTLQVCYYSQNPYAYYENGTLKGVEIEILNEYVVWLKSKKKIDLSLRPVPFVSFDDFYTSFKKSNKNRIGLGSVKVNEERANEIDYTVSYMKDVALCITNGNSPDVKTKNPEEVTRALGSMSALTINNTTLNKYVLDVKKLYIKDLKINYFVDETMILDEIGKNVLSFGYVNAVTFWYYLKSNPTKFLKIQKILGQSKDELAFVLPKGSPHKAMFEEFFSGPAGFKKTAAYRAILEKYLGAYMTQNVAVY